MFMRFESDPGLDYYVDMEARIARLEVAVDYAELKADGRELRTEIHRIRTTDFRILLGSLITVALGLAGIMAKGFGWL